MIKIVGEDLRQYDLGRQVELIPRGGATMKSVTFERGGVSLVTAIKEQDGKTVADIPNILLKAFGCLVVRYEGFDENGYEVEEKINVTVHKREKPADYEYVETETLKLGGASSWNDLTDKPFYVEEISSVRLPDDVNFEEAYDVGDLFGGDTLIAYRFNSIRPPSNFANLVVYNYKGRQQEGVNFYRLDETELGLSPGFVHLYSLEKYYKVDETTDELDFRFLFAEVIHDSIGLPKGTYVACVASYGGMMDMRTWNSNFFKIVDEYVYPINEKYLPESVEGVIIRSSTPGSTKRFKLGIDDTGAITATEV